MLSRARVTALVRKEFLDLRANRAAWLPALSTGVVLVMPFLVVIGVPALSGSPLADDPDIQRAVAVAGSLVKGAADLTPDGVAQAFLFQQFLLFPLLIPVIGVMSLASHSIVGEKQARSLEPLLATPITTMELLVAKVLGAALPAFALEASSVLLYMAGIVWLAEPGVARAVASARTLVLVGLVGPLLTLVALQLAVVVSARAADPRTAQQAAVLVVVPLVGVFVAQMVGWFWLTGPHLVLVAAGLGTVWIALLGLSVAAFDRETILIRWK